MYTEYTWQDWQNTPEMSRPSIRENEPHGPEMDISLSLRTTISFEVADAQLLIASKLVPLTSAPSPTTATTCSPVPLRSRAVAIPDATEIAVPA